MILADNKGDHELLVRIDERVYSIQKELENINRKIGEQYERIEKLEQWKSYVLGAAAVIGVVVASIVSLAINFL